MDYYKVRLYLSDALSADIQTYLTLNPTVTLRVTDTAGTLQFSGTLTTWASSSDYSYIDVVDATCTSSASVLPIVDIAANIHTATVKTTPIDADEFGIVDTADSNTLKKLTWANVKATLKTYFDSVYATISHFHLASDITSGTLDGDRLPAISTTKKGAVPATGTPSGKYLKDDGTFAAVTGSHTQNTDQYLDYGGLSESSAANVKDAVTKRHSNSLDHTSGNDQYIDHGGLNECSAVSLKDAVDKKHSNSLDHSNSNDPSGDQKAALVGTSGTPSNTNKYVTNDDSRNTNSRSPTTHASSHVTSGGDTIADAIAAGNSGLMSGTMLTKLNGIEASADVTDAGNVASTINGVADKSILVTNDKFTIIDSVGNVLKTILYSELKSLMSIFGRGSYDAVIYQSLGNTIAYSNDGTLIQSAVSGPTEGILDYVVANGYKNIYILDGTYYCALDLTDKTVKITGSGTGNTILKGCSGTYVINIVSTLTAGYPTTHPKVSIKDLDIDGNSRTYIGIVMKGVHWCAPLTNVRILSCTYGLKFNGTCGSLDFNSVEIIDCTYGYAAMGRTSGTVDNWDINYHFGIIHGCDHLIYIYGDNRRLKFYGTNIEMATTGLETNILIDIVMDGTYNPAQILFDGCSIEGDHTSTAFVRITGSGADSNYGGRAIAIKNCNFSCGNGSFVALNADICQFLVFEGNNVLGNTSISATITLGTKTLKSRINNNVAYAPGQYWIISATTTEGGDEIYGNVIAVPNPFPGEQVCNGRLTLTTATPVLTSNVTAATTIYFTPYNGAKISLYENGVWVTRLFAEASLALTNFTASTNFDIFGYWSAGALVLEAVAWTNTTTRATAIVTQDGIWCKTGYLYKRYLGTIRTTSTTGQTEWSPVARPANMLIYNAPGNQIVTKVKVIDPTDAWATAADWHEMNGSTLNRINIVNGLTYNESEIKSNVIAVSTSNSIGLSGIGLDSNVNIADLQAYFGGLTSMQAGCVETLVNGIPLGFHYLQALEAASGATVNFYGTAATYRNAGLIGWVKM
jgi:hypothetical protein